MKREREDRLISVLRKTLLSKKTLDRLAPLRNEPPREKMVLEEEFTPLGFHISRCFLRNLKRRG